MNTEKLIDLCVNHGLSEDEAVDGLFSLLVIGNTSQYTARVRAILDAEGVDYTVPGPRYCR